VPPAKKNLLGLWRRLGGEIEERGERREEMRATREEKYD
jgi:hypothetical protein